MDAYLVGVFEVIEVATLDVLRQARERCDRLVVGVVSDDLVSTVRSDVRMAPESERRELLSELRWVDEAVIHETPLVADLYFVADADFADLVPGAEVLVPTVYSTSPYSPYRPEGT